MSRGRNRELKNQNPRQDHPPAAGQAILVRRQLARVDPVLPTHLLLEPAPRNTAAAVTLAALDDRAWLFPAYRARVESVAAGVPALVGSLGAAGIWSPLPG